MKKNILISIVIILFISVAVVIGITSIRNNKESSNNGNNKESSNNGNNSSEESSEQTDTVIIIEAGISDKTKSTNEESSESGEEESEISSIIEEDTWGNGELIELESNENEDSGNVKWEIDPVTGAPIPIISDISIMENNDNIYKEQKDEMELIEEMQTSNWNGEFKDESVNIDAIDMSEE